MVHPGGFGARRPDFQLRRKWLPATICVVKPCGRMKRRRRRNAVWRTEINGSLRRISGRPATVTMVVRVSSRPRPQKVFARVSGFGELHEGLLAKWPWTDFLLV